MGIWDVGLEISAVHLRHISFSKKKNPFHSTFAVVFSFLRLERKCLYWPHAIAFGWLNKVRPTTTERVFSADRFKFSEDVPFQLTLFKFWAFCSFIWMLMNIQQSSAFGVHVFRAFEDHWLDKTCSVMQQSFLGSSSS